VLIPFLDAAYTSDAQAAYTDNFGSVISAQSIALSQVSAGLDFEMPVGPRTTLNGGISGVWSESTGSDVIPGFEGGRARVGLGMSHQVGKTGNLSFSGSYDGIGAPDFESYGAEMNWTINF
jgi:hypothetical protein